MQILYLGDSYTCGQGVSVECSYPTLLSKLIQKNTGQETNDTRIATTGFRSGHLLEHVQQIDLSNMSFDFIFLCIGVNDAYDGVPIEIFKQNFDQLVTRINPLLFPSGKLVLLNIPNYGYSPKCKYNLDHITLLIDTFNTFIAAYALQHGLTLVDIESLSRRDNTSYFASDGLHPSGLQYAQWAEKIYTTIESALS